MAAPSSHRIRFTAGLICGALIGIGAAFFLLDATRQNEAVALRERRAVVSLRALEDVVERLGGTGDGVRQAVSIWQKSDPAFVAIRVLAFEGISLEASSAAADVRDNPAPRRLVHDEKPIYDRGQRLRAAFETNRDEGVARKDEIEAEALPDGDLSMAAPVEREGSVTGMVETVTNLPVEKPAPDLLRAALCLLLPAVLYAAVCGLLGDRRILHGLLASALLLAGLVAYGSYSARTIAADNANTENLLSGQITKHATEASALLRSLSLDAGVSPATWDCDAYRKPRGMISAEGRIDTERLAAKSAEAARWVRKAFAALSLLSLAVLYLIGFGFVSRLWSVLRIHRQAYYYALPAMVGMLVLVFFPFLYGFALSFTDSNIYTMNKSFTETWVGFKNYTDIIGNVHVASRSADGSLIFDYRNFYWTLFITVAWTVSNVAFGVTVGLILALILNTKGLAFRPVYRVLLILPWAVPNYITALIWKGMFHRQFGVVNYVIQMFGGTTLSWFDRPFTSFLTALATNGWLSFPFMMVISLGALQSIPTDLYEAARVDGASRWQQFRAITLPSIKPALIPAIILSVVWTFNMFNIPYLVTGGQPAYSTEILITQAYKFAFEQYRYGYAAAYSTIIFGILLVYGTLQNRLTRATEGV